MEYFSHIAYRLSCDRVNVCFCHVFVTVKCGASMIVSPSKQTPVVGEVNIARYLARLLTPRYDADAVSATQTDTMLDHAAVLLRVNCDTSGALKSLGQLLGRKQWFANDQLSLADIVIWSSVKQSRLATTAPDNVRQWLARCDTLPEFANAGRLLVH